VQQALLDLANPLDLKFGKDFYADIPRSPGIYKMFGDDDGLLYVGKAKNLRTRLMSYRRIKITSQSRKSIRLVHQIAKIKWEICASEEAALIRENELLRDLKPPFNVVNTAPETYFYFSVKVLEDELIRHGQLPISITLSMKPADPEAAIFGAFKGIASCHRAFFAFRRLFWLISEHNDTDELYYPIHLFRRQKLHPHHCALEKIWLNRLAGFLHGNSPAPTQNEPELIQALREFVGRIKNCDPFHRNWMEEDITALMKFYRTGPARNSKIKPLSDFDSSTIEQTSLDDLMVKRLFSQR
jgi:hypothetical protein